MNQNNTNSKAVNSLQFLERRGVQHPLAVALVVKEFPETVREIPDSTELFDTTIFTPQQSIHE